MTMAALTDHDVLEHRANPDGDLTLCGLDVSEFVTEKRLEDAGRERCHMCQKLEAQMRSPGTPGSLR